MAAHQCGRRKLGQFHRRGQSRSGGRSQRDQPRRHGEEPGLGRQHDRFQRFHPDERSELELHQQRHQLWLVQRPRRQPLQHRRRRGESVRAREPVQRRLEQRLSNPESHRLAGDQGQEAERPNHRERIGRVHGRRGLLAQFLLDGGSLRDRRDGLESRQHSHHAGAVQHGGQERRHRHRQRERHHLHRREHRQLQGEPVLLVLRTDHRATAGADWPERDRRLVHRQCVADLERIDGCHQLQRASLRRRCAHDADRIRCGANPGVYRCHRAARRAVHLRSACGRRWRRGRLEHRQHRLARTHRPHGRGGKRRSKCIERDDQLDRFQCAFLQGFPRTQRCVARPDRHLDHQQLHGHHRGHRHAVHLRRQGER